MTVAIAVSEALAHQALANADDAVAQTAEALELAAPMQCMSPFVESGEAMARLLRQAIAKGVQPSFSRKLLQAIASEAGNYIGLGTPLDEHAYPPGTLSEALTEREHQVLRLLSLELSAREIADHLTISFNTARTYIRAIYGKLGVHSRDEAVDRAQTLKLL